MRRKAQIKKLIKQIIKDNKIDLLHDSAETIIRSLEEVLEKDEEKVKSIIKQRDLSLNFNFKTCYSIALNEGDWHEYAEEVTVKTRNGKPLTVIIKATPACKCIGFNYLADGQGISTVDNNSAHIINMWETEVKAKDGDVLFSALRHANTRGKESSSKELILAAAVHQYSFNTLWEDSSDKVWNVKLGNIQLMSPAYKLLPISPDKDMPFKQMETLQKLLNSPFDIEIKNKQGNKKTVHLCLTKLITCNFGVNKQHYMMNGILIKSSNEQNEKSLKALFGDRVFDKNQKLENLEDMIGGIVEDYLEKLDSIIDTELNPQKKSKFLLKKKKILNLSVQIIKIYIAYKSKGHPSNPSAIQARLSILMFLIEYTVSFNCKSGKDRTGYLSAEVNDLTTTIEANDGEIPDPYKKLSGKELEQLSEMADSSSSLKIAQNNTGYKGLKVKYPGMTNRIGKVTGTAKFAKF